MDTLSTARSIRSRASRAASDPACNRRRFSAVTTSISSTSPRSAARWSAKIVLQGSAATAASSRKVVIGGRPIVRTSDSTSATRITSRSCSCAAARRTCSSAVAKKRALPEATTRRSTVSAYRSRSRVSRSRHSSDETTPNASVRTSASDIREPYPLRDSFMVGQSTRRERTLAAAGRWAAAGIPIRTPKSRGFHLGMSPTVQMHCLGLCICTDRGLCSRTENSLMNQGLA